MSDNNLDQTSDLLEGSRKSKRPGRSLLPNSESVMEGTEALDTAENSKHLPFSFPKFSPPSDVEVVQSTTDKGDNSDIAEAESS